MKLPIYYHIHLDCQPGQSGKGLWIDLSPEWKGLVAESDLSQERVDMFRQNIGSLYLRNLGFNGSLDLARYRVDWGAWGPEHITVPGDATGLDICDACGMTFQGGKRLAPHNMDTLSQMTLCLQTFLWLADAMILNKIVERQS